MPSRLTTAIASQVQLGDPRISDGLEALRRGRVGDTTERGAVKALADELNDHAWTAPDQLDAGSATADDYIAAFALARASSSVWCALNDDPFDAAVGARYETQTALGNLAEVRSSIENLAPGLRAR